MHIIVIGAGVVGLSTAYYLRQEGHDVTVIEANSQVAMQASFANGGQLSYSYVAPLAGPGVLGKLPVWLTRRDSPVRFRASLEIAQWRWCLQFALACTQKRSDASTGELLALSLLSRALMHRLLVEEPELDFDFSRTGKLVLYRDRSPFLAARRNVEFQRSLGCQQQILSPDECLARESSLSTLRPHLAGGILTESEESGDCQRFCIGLEKRLRQMSVTFRLATAVTRLGRHRSGPVHAFAGTEPLHADQYVVAAGIASVPLMRQLGIELPLYPLKGYSLTLPVASSSASPSMSVTDFQRKVVYARLGLRMRVAGMADLVGHNTQIDLDRVNTLRQEVRAAFPLAGDVSNAIPWAGLRPATPTGTPIIGPTRFGNLWLNVGQGALGFTLALASGRRLTDLITGCAPRSPVGWRASVADALV